MYDDVKYNMQIQKGKYKCKDNKYSTETNALCLCVDALNCLGTML